ncbi:3'-5' exonuclease [Apiospora arundinis]|uniref:3'-5' exonuclease n=1 Tax=Apiospora arundinis TaxID=335852 RepID=A0ABR2IIS7_9PEZI
MNVVGRPLSRARSSALRMLSIAARKHAVPYPKFASTDAVATRNAPVVAALQNSNTAIGEPGGPIIAALPALSPIQLPGMARAIEAFFVDTPAGVSEAADCLWAETRDSCLYVDLEGTKLSRNGSLSLLTIYSPLARRAFVLDVFTLKSVAFDQTGSRECSIRTILESNRYKKAFFDVRNDSDALFYHFGINLNNVEDIQLMENATRRDGRRHLLAGLSGCMPQALSPAEKIEWVKSKAAGKALFNPKSGGASEVFDVRPLSPEMISYCVGDVYYLPRLREKHWHKLSKGWRRRVIKESKARVLESQQTDYEPHSKDKVKSPWHTDPVDRAGYWPRYLGKSF